MKKVYVFFADGFEEIEAMAPVDILRRAGLQVVMVSVTDDEIVKGAHGVSMFCDKNIANCDFSDAELLLLPGGMPGAASLGKSEALCKALLRHAEACTDGIGQFELVARQKGDMLSRLRKLFGRCRIHR